MKETVEDVQEVEEAEEEFKIEEIKENECIELEEPKCKEIEVQVDEQPSQDQSQIDMLSQSLISMKEQMDKIQSQVNNLKTQAPETSKPEKCNYSNSKTQ